MPLQMVHLSVAHRLAERVDPQGNRDLYYVGAVAPDGIHSRASATREDKRRVHLATGPTQPLHDRLQRIDDFIDAWQARIDSGFLLGWATHLVADSVWSRHVIHGVWADATLEMEQAERDRRYYEEADQADFNLFRRLPWRTMVWNRLAAAEIPGFADLLSAEEIGAWRDRILKWFTETKQEPMVDLTVITMALIERFVEITVTLLENGIDRGFVESIGSVPGIEGNDLFRRTDGV